MHPIKAHMIKLVPTVTTDGNVLFHAGVLFSQENAKCWLFGRCTFSGLDDAVVYQNGQI